MSRPRNFVSELKDKAKVIRKQNEAPDDFNGTLVSASEDYVIFLEYADGYLCGALVVNRVDYPGFVTQVQSVAEALA